MPSRSSRGGRFGAPVLFLVLLSATAGCAGTVTRGSPTPERELALPPSVRAVDLALAGGAEGAGRLYFADAEGERILVFAAADGRALGSWPLRGPDAAPVAPAALAVGAGWLLVAERAAARVRAFDPEDGSALAELPAAVGLEAPGALAAWPLRRGWHTVLVGDLESVAGRVAPAGVVRVWQMRRRPDGRTHAWRARTLRQDAEGEPLPPIRALAEDPAQDLTLVLTEPDGRLHRFRSDGTPLGFAPPGMAATGWRRVIGVDCPGGGRFWLALREDGTIERRGGRELGLEGRSPPLPGARALAWHAAAEERLIVLFSDRVGWYRPAALGLGHCPGERP